MDKKIMAIATVVALIAIIGGIAYAMHKEDGRCDYSLLDSTDNIKEGFTVTYDGVDEDGTIHSKKVVDSVENGKVNYTLYIDIQDQSCFYELDHFLPGFPIDYTSNIPAGIKVVKDGDCYVFGPIVLPHLSAFAVHHMPHPPYQLIQDLPALRQIGLQGRERMVQLFVALVEKILARMFRLAQGGLIALGVPLKEILVAADQEHWGQVIHYLRALRIH